MVEVFLSYRRADAAGSAGRLYGSLSQHFAAEGIFRDIDSIEAGENFDHVIRDALRTAAVVLVVIGPRWLELRADDGTRRLEDPRDYVRREIELALAAETLVIPVLVENAAMPTAGALPPTIRELSLRNAVELSDRRWADDVHTLVTQLERGGVVPLKPARPSGHRVVTSALAGFVPDLFDLIHRPRRFLRRRAAVRPPELARACVFFTVTALLAVVLMLSAYTPRQSTVSFGLTDLVTGLLGTLVLSAPLWLAWRLVGVRGHYARLLVMLLYQAAVLHLAATLIGWTVVVALDLGSMNLVAETIGEAMTPGTSIGAALATVRRRLEPVAATTAMRLGLALATLIFAVAAAWTVWSWGAYRDVFEVSRVRSAVALAFLVAIVWTVARLVGLLAAGWR
jgi:hypothetical protein